MSQTPVLALQLVEGNIHTVLKWTYFMIQVSVYYKPLICFYVHIRFSSPFQSLTWFHNWMVSGNYRWRKQYQHKISKTFTSAQSALGMSLVREEPRHTSTCDQPCRPDHTGQAASQVGAATHKHMRPTLPARPHWAGCWSGGAATHKHMQPNLPARPHWAGCRSGGTATHKHMQPNLPARPHRAGCRSGGAATHKHMQPTLPARPHWAGSQSGRSHNTYTCGQPCWWDHTQSVYIARTSSPLWMQSSSKAL